MRAGEVARRAGVNVETLRYYQRRGLLPEPARMPGEGSESSHARREAFYRHCGNCCSAQVLPSGSLKVTNEPHG